MADIQTRFSRRRFLKSLAVAGIGSTVTGAYGKAVESQWLEVGRHTVPIGKAPRPQALKILHLSDLHASNLVSLDFIERAIRKGLELNPDVICLTGDYITRKYDQWDRYAKVLSLLPKAAPTFATLGNHDGGEWCRKIHGYGDSIEVRACLDRAGIALLDNGSLRLERRGWELNVVGMGDIWENDFRPADAFSKVTPGQNHVTIALSHNPDTKDPLKPYPWDLLLCGHTHGGQVRLPLLGAPIAPVKDRRFVKGLHLWDNRWIHITKGVGNVYGLRINCRPEVSLLTLV